MQKLTYEKHQRDYTLLTTSVVADELLSKNFENTTNYKMNPFFALVKNGVFYHFLPAIDYKGIPESYFAKNSIEDFKVFIEENDKKLLEAEEFFESRHDDPVAAIGKVHDYMRELFAIVMVAAYASGYLDDLDAEIKDLCIKTRERYENIHRDGITLERRLLNEIEEKHNIQKDSLEYLTENEFEKFAVSGELPSDFMQRKEFFFCKYSKNKRELFSEDEAREMLSEIDQTYGAIHNVDEIKGNIACLGKASGRVRVIKLIKEAAEFNEGEILVASMTDPRYLSIMKKAAAIVTDEGGITCHAAIVARELQIPCIIGTKISTQVLKDGDLVEVDANEGVVRILK